MKLKLLIGALVGALAGTSVQAAQLASVEGQVLVNTGSGFVAAKSGATLRAGDKIMSGSGASAVISYSSNCSTTVAPNSVVVVSSTIPCGGVMYQGADAGGVDPTLVIGGVVVAGGVAAAVILSRDSSNGAPASP